MDWFDRLHKEKEELQTRMLKLVTFCDAPAFNRMSDDGKKLMKNQR